MGAAIEDDADDPMALAAGGFVLAFLGADREVALASIARAAAVNPASATVASLGAHANHPDEAGAYAARALSLSPSHPLAFEAHLGLGLRAEIEERWDNAAACTARAVQVDPGFGSGYLLHAIALAWADAPSPPAPRPPRPRTRTRFSLTHVREFQIPPEKRRLTAAVSCTAAASARSRPSDFGSVITSK